MFSYNDANINFHHSFDTYPTENNISDSTIHAHKKHEIFYFLQGKASYLVEGHIYKLFPGSIMIMRSGELHKVEIKADAPYERMVLHFDEAIIDFIDPEHKLLEPFYSRPLGVGNLFLPNGIRTSHIYECMKSIDSAPENNEMRKLAISANLFSILYEIKMAYLERDNELLNKKAVSPAGEIIEFINANLGAELSLELLSSKFFISKNHLNRVFKTSTGVTVWEYIKLKRLMLARSHILEGASASAACENSGFKDYSAFFRAYKKQFGVSPREVALVKHQ